MDASVITSVLKGLLGGRHPGNHKPHKPNPDLDANETNPTVKKIEPHFKFKPMKAVRKVVKTPTTKAGTPTGVTVVERADRPDDTKVQSHTVDGHHVGTIQKIAQRGTWVGKTAAKNSRTFEHSSRKRVTEFLEKAHSSRNMAEAVLAAVSKKPRYGLMREAKEVKPGSMIRYGVEAGKKKGRTIIVSRNARVKSVDADKVTTHNGIALSHSQKVGSRSNMEKHLDWHIIKEDDLQELSRKTLTKYQQDAIHDYSKSLKKKRMDGWYRASDKLNKHSSSVKVKATD